VGGDNLSRRTLLEILVEGEVLPENIDVDEELERIADQEVAAVNQLLVGMKEQEAAVEAEPDSEQKDANAAA